MQFLILQNPRPARNHDAFEKRAMKMMLLYEEGDKDKDCIRNWKPRKCAADPIYILPDSIHPTAAATDFFWNFVVGMGT